eukprot:CAMPEP_0113470152 /NCGR_PEP_ID=MMETSP0014_2-20120614/16287_1 /TAXON_ID=2857 /ORGANISM="Nitzschia sp." /LENGTH=86 /DNA_ID=CAMNT_0000362691 /DNA_START=294 /DNA_END=554 /DNA_ORIENTATION=- /assembly_acc=CAM_ASM_000159
MSFFAVATCARSCGLNFRLKTSKISTSRLSGEFLNLKVGPRPRDSMFTILLFIPTTQLTLNDDSSSTLWNDASCGKLIKYPMSISA